MWVWLDEQLEGDEQGRSSISKIRGRSGKPESLHEVKVDGSLDQKAKTCSGYQNTLNNKTESPIVKVLT